LYLSLHYKDHYIVHIPLIYEIFYQSYQLQLRSIRALRRHLSKKQPLNVCIETKCCKLRLQLFMPCNNEVKALKADQTLVPDYTLYLNNYNIFYMSNNAYHKIF